MNNVVGKLLVVMQLVFSILFMCFAGAVFTFQAQWRTAAISAQEKYENAEQQRKDKESVLSWKTITRTSLNFQMTTDSFSNESILQRLGCALTWGTLLVWVWTWNA